MDVPHANPDTKAAVFSTEVAWCNALMATREYAMLAALWKKKEEALEERLRSLKITAEERHITAHELSAYKLAVRTLVDHRDTNLNLLRDEEKKETPEPAHRKKPVL